jgi:hypothetical protein
MSPSNLDEELYADEEQDQALDGRAQRLITALKFFLIAALFIVPILALLKPSFTHPTAPPVLTPANGIQIQTTDFSAIHKPLCSGEFCVGSL